MYIKHISMPPIFANEEFDVSDEKMLAIDIKAFILGLYTISMKHIL